MHPQLIRIGDFFLPTYGALVALGFVLALWVASKLAHRGGIDPDKVVGLGVYCALAGIIGAKLLMFVFDLDYYWNHPGEMFSLNTLQSGGVFQGGLVLALITAYVYMRNKGLPVLATADAFAPGVALGHAIGRMGCFSAGCCWGIECHRPWAITFTNPMAGEMFGTPLNIPLHPTQLYEAAGEFIIFAWLYRFYFRERRQGTVIGLYLMLYSLLRFIVEFLRAHDHPNPFGGPFSTTQWLSIGLAALGLWLFYRRKAAPAHGKGAARA